MRIVATNLIKRKIRHAFSFFKGLPHYWLGVVLQESRWFGIFGPFLILVFPATSFWISYFTVVSVALLRLLFDHCFGALKTEQAWVKCAMSIRA